MPNKNIHPVFGKPMVVWSIEACQRSKYIDEVFVSTEDKRVEEISLSAGASIIRRPLELSGGAVPKMEVIRHADTWYARERGRHPEVLVSVQANSPEIRHTDIDAGIELLRRENLWEVFSVELNGVQNASFRVLRQGCLHNTFLSAHIGVICAECIDVHTIEDVREIEKKYGDANTLIERVR